MGAEQVGLSPFLRIRMKAGVTAAEFFRLGPARLVPD